MSIYRFDIDITSVLRKQEPYYLGEPEMVSKFLTHKQVVFLPDCEESHEIVGSFFLSCKSIRVYLLNQLCTTLLSMQTSKYSSQELDSIKYLVGN